MTAQHILKLIEEVDPNDSAALDEIDARVACFVEDWDYGGAQINKAIEYERCQK